MPLELTNGDISVLNRQFGMNFPANAKVLTDADKFRVGMAMDADYVGGVAQTAANGGVPALLTTWVDPSYIEVVLAPLKMGEIFGEVQKGSRTTSSVIFPLVEANGETSTYGDFNDNGMSGANVNYVSRQPYAYQTNIKIGEIEQEIAAEARVDWVQQHQIAAARTLNQMQNQSYLYGIAGIKNYGILNDPDLPASIVGVNWYSLTALEVFNEVIKLFNQLIAQGQAHVTPDSAMTLIMSNTIVSNLNKTNEFGLNVRTLLSDNFPNMKIEVVPQYKTQAGEMIQLILDNYNGRKTVEMAFTEKMRVHAVEMKTSGWLQKRSQGTLGAVIYYPMFVASMLASNTAP